MEKLGKENKIFLKAYVDFFFFFSFFGHLSSEMTTKV